MEAEQEPALSARQRARLAARIAELRALSDMSARGLAEAAGLGQSTVNKLLGGQGNPTLGTLLRLVSVFELSSIEELLGATATEAFADLGD